MFLEYFPLLLLLIPLHGPCHAHVFKGPLPQRRIVVTFNRSTTGLVFSPYAKRSEKGIIPSVSEYNLKEIKTMFEVVSTKFQMTATYATGADDEKYKGNSTYHNNSEKVVLSAEAASLVNRDHRRIVVTVLIGICVSPQTIRQRQTEVELAFESAAIANKNFPGTAIGVIFTNKQISEVEAQITFNHLLLHKGRARKENLLMGSRQSCNLVNAEEEEEDRKVAKILNGIILVSDFIICTLPLEPGEGASGVEAVMEHVKEEVRGYKRTILGINPNIEVMFETGWPDKGPEGWESVPNLVKYWRLVDAWAEEEQIKVWMMEAFDIQLKSWRPTEAHFGWWTLLQNRDAGRVAGYVEKINIPPSTEEPEGTPTNPWMFVGVAVGILLVVCLTAAIVFLYIRVNKLNEILTTEDVREFMDGVAVTYTEENGHAQSALRIPYNKDRFEIEKNRISIQRHHRLGAGQFGHVFQAVVEMTPGNKTEVALKMTKPGCAKAGIKGMLSEIKVLAYLGKHPNIVSIVGAYTQEMKKGTVYIALELCTLGSLEKFLRNNKFSDAQAENAEMSALFKVCREEDGVRYVNLKPDITFPDMLRWAYEIASGMEFLGVKNVVHADLAARNVLLTGNKTAKITDFGLSRRLYAHTKYVKQQEEPLPWRWMSLESLKKLEFSPQSDVWSYGVTLWEIFSFGDVPYPGLAWSLNFVLDLEEGLRMPSPKRASPEIYQVMLDCWAEVPKKRPKFPELKEILAQLLGMADS